MSEIVTREEGDRAGSFCLICGAHCEWDVELAHKPGCPSPANKRTEISLISRNDLMFLDLDKEPNVMRLVMTAKSLYDRIAAQEAELARPRPMAEAFDERYTKALEEMAADLEMSVSQVLRCAVRGYQLEWAKARGKVQETHLMPTEADWQALLSPTPPQGGESGAVE